MQKKICAAYEEGAVTDQMYQRQFAKFHAGDFSLDNAPWSGTKESTNKCSWSWDDQIQTLIENNQCYTKQEIANILKISKSMKLLVKMKKCVFYFMEKTKQTVYPTQKNVRFCALAW